jgi:hypothetical protein
MVGSDIGDFVICGVIGLVILICLVFYILPMNKEED